MKNYVLSALLGAVMLAGATQAGAAGQKAESGKRGGFLVQADIDYGGDDVATVYFDDDSSQDLKAGQGLAISLGGWFRPIESSPFEIQASVGMPAGESVADTGR